MELESATKKLAQLGNPTRLKVIRLLVQAGPQGLSVGEVQEHVGVPLSTLSHHLSLLVNVGLISQTREGRVLRCRVAMPLLRELLDFLLEDCCAGVMQKKPDQPPETR